MCWWTAPIRAGVAPSCSIDLHCSYALYNATGASVLDHGLAHLCSDLIGPVGLGYVRYVVMQYAAVGDEVLRVAGGIDDLGVGSRDPETIGQFPAVHAGKNDIRQQDVDGPGVAFRHCQSLAALGCLEHAVT